jgi:hypothetical protein
VIIRTLLLTGQEEAGLFVINSVLTLFGFLAVLVLAAAARSRRRVIGTGVIGGILAWGLARATVHFSGRGTSLSDVLLGGTREFWFSGLTVGVAGWLVGLVLTNEVMARGQRNPETPLGLSDESETR